MQGENWSDGFRMMNPLVKCLAQFLQVLFSLFSDEKITATATAQSQPQIPSFQVSSLLKMSPKYHD